MDRNELIDLYKDTAIEFAKTKDGCSPVAFLFSEEGNIGIPMSFENDKEKHRMFAAVQKKARDINAHAGIFITEAWAVKVDKKDCPDFDSDDYVRPAEHPDKIEILTIVAADHAGTSIWSAEIVRNGEIVRVEEGEVFDGDGQDSIFNNVFLRTLN